MTTFGCGPEINPVEARTTVHSLCLPWLVTVAECNMRSSDVLAKSLSKLGTQIQCILMRITPIGVVVDHLGKYRVVKK